jgi:hypothetical protein
VFSDLRVRLNADDCDAIKRSFGIVVRDNVGVDYRRLAAYFVGPEAAAHAFLDHLQQQEALTLPAGRGSFSAASAGAGAGAGAPAAAMGGSRSFVDPVSADAPRWARGSGPAQLAESSTVAFEAFRDRAPPPAGLLPTSIGHTQWSHPAAVSVGGTRVAGADPGLGPGLSGIAPHASRGSGMSASWDGSRQQAPDYPPSTVGGWLRTVSLSSLPSSTLPPSSGRVSVSIPKAPHPLIPRLAVAPPHTHIHTHTHVTTCHQATTVH